MKIIKYIKKHRVKAVIILILLTWYFFSLPASLFTDPSCTVIEDRDGNLLGARIADDGQWRFPYNAHVPEKFEKAIIQFEDRYFYYHPGINPKSIFRALIQNIKARKIMSGGSTITMQVLRLSRKGKPRTVFQKLIETILSTRLELGYSKKEILALYASNAPFGGNVVGLDAAAWRYFGRSPGKLSWAETVTLAVLPNAPALIFPGKNQRKLLVKRNRLLDRLLEAGAYDSLTCELAKTEPLPGKPLPLPNNAPHLLTRIYLKNKGERIKTTVDGQLQDRVNRIVENHHKVIKANEIHNAAAIVIEVESGDVLVYVGNTQNSGKPEYGSDVDIITAPRSTGSIMKPILFAAMLDDGEILPNTFVPDIPTQIAGYSPKNYSLTYSGAVHAKRALARSLNVPAVRMLQQHGVERFHYLLQKLEMSTIVFPADHYGLSLILGGAEGTLWDLTAIYASFSRILNHYNEFSGRYIEDDMRKPGYIFKEMDVDKETINITQQNREKGILSAGSIWLAYEALIEVNRPDAESGWKFFSSSGKIAWKTGTSFGYRDGWAIGTTPEYVVGVWVGNADGEGRPGLTGAGTAAPIIFDIFDLLPNPGWFEIPYDELRQVEICRKSGHRATDICEPVDSMWVQETGLKTPPCPYHILIHLDENRKYRVTSDCEDVSGMVHQSWFVLPPVQEWYYKSKDPTYKVLPQYRPDCGNAERIKVMDLIYPKQTTKIYIPTELDGTPGQAVFEVAHRKPATEIYWHLDKQYLGATKHIHQMGIRPEQGKHILTLVDENGATLTKVFRVVGKEE
ncbi:MAG: penicillin-binding protein 1C [Bacteroidota bacterium]